MNTARLGGGVVAQGSACCSAQERQVSGQSAASHRTGRRIIRFGTGVVGLLLGETGTQGLVTRLLQ